MLINFNPGQIVYVIYRNPHTQDVANIQEAAVVQAPDSPNQLALFLYETYYPISEDLAIYQSKEEAEQAYFEAFGSADIEEYYG
ncbi:transcriptional regulator [Bacillus sp. FJAT-49732]|uniref:Transcriptional regulator n=1 Tax=Lederbergia citrisecunda TaxID=2833583 RepID=A0A942TR97_9BACI|nr:transcriptional regulator SplA domain-containing protein [Lederbergia citrisecunda]MBS4201893.1 transcriptional regulator [Lederbergia citrisecunda]